MSWWWRTVRRGVDRALLVDAYVVLRWLTEGASEPRATLEEQMRATAVARKLCEKIHRRLYGDLPEEVSQFVRPRKGQQHPDR